MAKNTRRITNQLGRSQVTGLVDKNNNNLLADSEADGYVSFDNVRIHGDLRVYGAQSIVNSTTLTIADKNIVLAKNAYDSEQYNNVGITVTDSDNLFERGTSPTFQYNNQRDAWIANRKILVNVNKEAATDSDSLVTISSLEANIIASPTIIAVKSRLDSDDAQLQALNTQVGLIKSRLDSDNTQLQLLNTSIASSSASLSGINAKVNNLIARADSDSGVISSLQTATNNNTAQLDVQLDSDSVVNMFNEYSLINTTADSDVLIPLFQKVMNDFQIKDVSGNTIFSFYKQ